MIKRVLAFLLIAVLLTSMLAGCDNAESETTEQGSDAAQSSTPQYVYQAKYSSLNIDEASQLDDIREYCVSGDYLFFCADCVTGKDVYTDPLGETVIDEETGEPIEIDLYETALFRMDLNSGETLRLGGFHILDVPEGMLGSSYVNAMAVGADGTLWIINRMSTYSYDVPEDFDAENDDYWNYYVPGETQVLLCQYDAKGQQMNTVDLGTLGDVYPRDLIVDQGGNIYLNTGEMIYVFDSEGTSLMELTNENWSELTQISDTEVGLIGYNADYFTRQLRMIDLEAKDYGEVIELPYNASNLYRGFGDYQLIYDDYGDVVYGYNMETGESEKLFSWLDCDVNCDSFINYEFSVLPDGRIVALTEDYSKTPVEYEFVQLEKVDASTLPQKQELTLACMYVSQDIRNEVINFNRSHDDVRIAVQDYSEYNTDEDYTAGLVKLNTEILSGIMPDILDTSGLPIDQYAAKGLLVDLWTLIDNDAELSREDLMTHLFDVMSTNGKLYQITDFFTIRTAVGNADVIGDRSGWTLDEMLEVKATMPENSTIFGDGDTKYGILSSCIGRSIAGFINWEENTCSFDSQEFIDLLNFANSFPAEFDWNNYDYESSEGTYSRFRNGRQLLLDAYISDFQYMQVLSAMVGGNPAYVGYPSATGNGSAFGLGDASLAISTACERTDLAWSFVRTFLTEDYQSTDYIWSFPTNRHSFETLVEREMTPQYETDPETGEQVEVSNGTWAWDDLEIEVYSMTQEDYDKFMQLYEACNSIYSSNDTVYALILEEVAAFFDGQKTAEETAKIIQDRVSLYVMEQG